MKYYYKANNSFLNYQSKFSITWGLVPSDGTVGRAIVDNLSSHSVECADFITDELLRFIYSCLCENSGVL